MPPSLPTDQDRTSTSSERIMFTVDPSSESGTDTAAKGQCVLSPCQKIRPRLKLGRFSCTTSVKRAQQLVRICRLILKQFAEILPGAVAAQSSDDFGADQAEAKITAGVDNVEHEQVL